jgi:hypothetical protein
MIQDFYRNKVMRDAVRQYIDDCFVKEAVEKMFNREDVTHIADAKELLDKAFSSMEVDFGAKKETNNINEAR